MFQMLLFIIYTTDICQMSSKYVQRLILCKVSLTFCSFTVLSKLKALQIIKQGRSIDYQASTR